MGSLLPLMVEESGMTPIQLFGLFCVLVAIVGGGLTLVGIVIPPLTLRRQVLLGLFGCALVASPALSRSLGLASPAATAVPPTPAPTVPAPTPTVPTLTPAVPTFTAIATVAVPTPAQGPTASPTPDPSALLHLDRGKAAS